MSWTKPIPATVWSAIEAYLAFAYEGGPPATVQSRIHLLRGAADNAFYQSSSFEPEPKQDPIRLSLRLGNRWYPHMKLVVERAPDGSGHLFRADTHDRHIHLGPDSREYAAFRELIEKNQSLASQIEAAWEERGLPTFKSFLREDLARRAPCKIPRSL